MTIDQKMPVSDFPGSYATKEWLKRYKKGYLKIDCGEWSYGQPIIRSEEEDSPRKLTIGRFCSIGGDVKIYIGRKGRHPINSLSSYPIHLAVSYSTKSKLISKPLDNLLPISPSQKFLDVEIGHDVWIGDGVTIFAGCTIGTGAVIGAGAIVTKNIPPYTVVGGIPAKIIKTRFTEDIVKRLLNSEWWNIEPDQLWELFGEGVYSSNITEILDILESRSTLALNDKSMNQPKPSF